MPQRLFLGRTDSKLFVKNVDGTYNYDHGKVSLRFIFVYIGMLLSILRQYYRGKMFDVKLNQLSDIFLDYSSKAISLRTGDHQNGCDSNIACRQTDVWLTEQKLGIPVFFHDRFNLSRRRRGVIHFRSAKPL